MCWGSFRGRCGGEILPRTRRLLGKGRKRGEGEEVSGAGGGFVLGE